MTGAEQPLLERVTPSVRKAAIRYRREAMRGDLHAALDGLARHIAGMGSGEPTEDAIALIMLRAELLHLDGQDTQALEQFDLLIKSRLRGANFRLRAVIEQNQIEIRLRGFDPNAGGQFYHLVDRMRTAGVEWQDTEVIARAWTAVEKGEHAQALAGLWAEAVRTYREACWMVHRQAMNQLGHEWLRMSELIDAAYCAILAEDDKLAEHIGEELLARRDLSLVRAAIDKVLATANLRRHFCVACGLLTAISDAIPGDTLREVANWLLRRCDEPGDGKGTDGALNCSWQALEPIASRLPAEVACQATEIAIHHPVWAGTPPSPGLSWVVREQMVRTVGHLVGALPVGELERVAEAALPLAMERRSDADYPDVVNLLCHLAERGGDPIRREIGKRLYRPGQPRDYLLGQVAEQFGQEFVPPDRLARLPSEVAARIRLQVQRRPSEDGFVTVPGAVMVAPRCAVGDVLIERTVLNLIDWEALVRHRRRLPAEGIGEMVRAAVELACDRENLLPNRMGLIRGLIRLSDVLDESLTEMAFSALEPLASGEVLEPTGLPTSEENAHPLNVFRMNMGTPLDLRSIALVALAHLGRHDPNRYRRRLEVILEEALTDSRVQVRRGAFAAVRDFPGLSAGPLLAVLLGTRDADPNGAASAFAALAGKQELSLNRNHWQLLLYSLRLASRSSSVELRRNAASALASLLRRPPKGKLHAECRMLLEVFGSDLCASVREAAG